MGKIIINADAEKQNPFPKIKSYSVAEIMAAGGPEAFATKLGKDTGRLIASLKTLPKDAFLTEEEAEIALEMLRNNK